MGQHGKPAGAQERADAIAKFIDDEGKGKAEVLVYGNDGIALYINNRFNRSIAGPVHEGLDTLQMIVGMPLVDKISEAVAVVKPNLDSIEIHVDDEYTLSLETSDAVRLYMSLGRLLGLSGKGL